MEFENFPSSSHECKSFLRNLWDGLTPPIPEEDLIGGWYAGMFFQPGKKKGTLCVGRITKRFLLDSNGPVEKLEMDCLKPAFGPSSTNLEEFPAHIGKDYGLFKSFNMIAGPLQLSYKEGGKWSFPKYPDLYLYFTRVEKEDRLKWFIEIYHI